jgi:hypothetical protein
MHEEIRYPVCPHRNVAAAYQRFLGPDSGGIERFFPDARMQRVDGTLLIVRLRGRKAVSGAVHELQRAAHGIGLAGRAASRTIGELNAALANAWSITASACWVFALSSGKDAMHLIGQTATLLFGSRPGRLPV